MNHIRDKIPDMKARLNTLMGQAQQELNAFGDEALFGDKNQQGAIVLRLMTQFARDFVSSIEGTSVDISTKELSGGARIYYIFNDVFGNALANLDATANLGDQDIRTAIRNSSGPRPSLFVPEVAFDLLVKPQIKLLESPSSRCVELVYEELVKICHNCTSPVSLKQGRVLILPILTATCRNYNVSLASTPGLSTLFRNCLGRGWDPPQITPKASLIFNPRTSTRIIPPSWRARRAPPLPTSTHQSQGRVSLHGSIDFAIFWLRSGYLLHFPPSHNRPNL